MLIYVRFWLLLHIYRLEEQEDEKDLPATEELLAIGKQIHDISQSRADKQKKIAADLKSKQDEPNATQR